jgi:hypothetical protein
VRSVPIGRDQNYGVGALLCGGKGLCAIAHCAGRIGVGAVVGVLYYRASRRRSRRAIGAR